LNFLPVDGAGAIVSKGAPEVLGFVLAEIIDAGAGVGMDRASVWGGWLGGQPMKDVKFRAELALGFGCGRCGPSGSGVLEEGGAAEEGVDVYLRFEQVGEEVDIERFSRRC
jgi:hypothetical protein